MAQPAPPSGADVQVEWESAVFNERYRKVKVIGKGSFGEAVLVRSRANGRRYVVKAIETAAMSPKEKRDIANEIRIMSTLNHPNIIKYQEHFEDGTRIFIAMEYADGGDLHQRIREQRKVEPSAPFDPKLCVFWMLQIAMALKYLHDRHILHRDLKTANIFLTTRNVVKLGDFGISTVLQNTVACAKTVCGTPYYFSPELCMNKPYNNKSDVWALGIILYETLTLMRPFNAKSLKDLIKKILIGQYEPLPTNIPEEVRSVCASLLSLNPQMRPSVNTLLESPFVQRSLATFSKELEEQSRRERDEHEAKRAAAPNAPPPAAGVAGSPPLPPPPAVDARLQMAQLKAMGRGDLRAMMMAKPSASLQAELSGPQQGAANESPQSDRVAVVGDTEDERESIEQKNVLARQAGEIATRQGRLGGHEDEFGDPNAPAGATHIQLPDGTAVPPADARIAIEAVITPALTQQAIDLVCDLLASPHQPSTAAIQREIGQLLGVNRAMYANAIGQIALWESKQHHAA